MPEYHLTWERDTRFLYLYIMASKKIFTGHKSKSELSITRQYDGAMLFEITTEDGIKASVILTKTDLHDLQRDLYAYLNFSKNV